MIGYWALVKMVVFTVALTVAALLGEGPGETRLFYCDPRRSDQKGACEDTHT